MATVAICNPGHARNQPRRHSYTPKSDLLECPENFEQKRSASLETSPMSGIKLGSKTAQLAAKSFWNMDMYNDSLQKIAEYAVIESSSLGSSIESITDETEDPFNKSVEEEYTLSPIVPHLIDLPFSLTPRSTPSSPTQSPQMLLKRSKSACVERKTSTEKRNTIPRKISPAAYTPTTAAKVRFHLSCTESPLKNEQTATKRNGSADDGYHEW